MYDPIETFANDLCKDKGVNLSAEKVTDGYAISLAKMGRPRQHYATLSPSSAKSFLTGLTIGLLMAEVGMSVPDEDDEDDDYATLDDFGDEIPEYVMELIKDSVACPDCVSTLTQPVLTKFGAWKVEVLHSSTCPYAAKFVQDD